MELSIPRPSRFGLAATVTSHGWYRLSPFEWDPESETLSHTTCCDDSLTRVSIRVVGDAIGVRSTASVSREAIRDRVRRMLQLDLDLTDFHERCSRSSILSEVPTRRLGRLLCSPDVFEDAVKIILTTNTHWSRTVEMNRRLLENFGPREGELRAFPRPVDIAAATEAELRTHGRVGYRARSIHKLATSFTKRTIDLSTRPDPSSCEYDDLYEWYLKLPGIGPYGAAHLMAMDGRHDRIAVDTEFRAWVRQTYHGGRKVRDSTMLRHYQQWGPWKYIAYWCEMSLGDG